MRAGKNTISNEFELYLDDDEAKELKEIVESAKLPQRRMLWRKLMDAL